MPIYKWFITYHFLMVSMATDSKPYTNMKPKPRGILDLHRSTLESRRVRKEFENVKTLKLLAEENVLRECMTRRGDRCFSAAVQRDIFHENHMRSIIDARKRVLENQAEKVRKYNEDVQSLKEKEELRNEEFRKSAQRQLLFNSSHELQELQLRMRCMQNAKELAEQMAQRKAAQNEKKVKEKESGQHAVSETTGADATDRLDRERSRMLREKYKRELEDQIRWKEKEIENQRKEQLKEAGQAKVVRAMTAHENRRFMNNQMEQRRQLRESIDEFLKQCATSKRKEKLDSEAIEERISREARKKMEWDETLEEMRKEKVRQKQALQQQAEINLLQRKWKQLHIHGENHEQKKRQWDIEEKKKQEEEARRRQELQESFLAQIKNREIQLLKEIMQEERYEAQLREKEMTERRERQIAEMKRRGNQKGMLDDLQQQINDLLARKSLEKEREICEFNSRMRNLEMQESLIDNERKKLTAQMSTKTVKFPRLKMSSTVR